MYDGTAAIIACFLTARVLIVQWVHVKEREEMTSLEDGSGQITITETWGRAVA